MSNGNDKLMNFALEARANYRSLIPTAGEADPLFSVKDITLAAKEPDRQLPARLYIPTPEPENERYPLVLFLHGGGWVSGDLDTHDVLIRSLALHLNAVVLAVDYRMSPEFDGLAQLDDSLVALNWLYEHAGELKGNINQIVLVGDSAGGAMAANLSNRLAEEGSAIKVAAQWLMYPVVNFDFDTPTMREYGADRFPDKGFMALARQAYLPADAAEDDPRLVPYYSRHTHGIPTIISLAGEDPLTSSGQEYAAQLSEKNIKCECTVYPGQAHGFIQFYKDKTANPLGEQALKDGLKTLRGWLAGR